MRVAVVGAGIVGVATAHALHEDSHQVTVYERQSSVATESSFANAGFLAPGYVTPWAAPGMVRKVLGQFFERDAAVRLGGWPSAALAAWLWRWWRACDGRIHLNNRSAMLALARDSLARKQALAKALALDHEQARGVLVLLRGDKEVARARPGLKLLADLGLNFHLVDADGCRRIEPALDGNTGLKAGIHLPDAEVGNCRQFALQLKAELQKSGVVFHLQREVTRLEHGIDVLVHARPVAGDSDTAPSGARPVQPDAVRTERFDAVVVCAALGANALLRPLRLPMLPVYGYSITLPVRHHEAHPDMGPRSGLMDERFKVAITRLGDRLRVAGSAELGGDPKQLNDAAVSTLYRALQDWFPSATRAASAQTWKGARPMLPDGPPAIGESATPGVWVNTGHGSSGWALACGSARLVADMIQRRDTAVDPQPFSPMRWQ